MRECYRFVSFRRWAACVSWFKCNQCLMMTIRGEQSIPSSGVRKIRKRPRPLKRAAFQRLSYQIPTNADISCSAPACKLIFPDPMRQESGEAQVAHNQPLMLCCSVQGPVRKWSIIQISPRLFQSSMEVEETGSSDVILGTALAENVLYCLFLSFLSQT
jgi:hypothetical protein